jgi:hypothetical protein
MAATDAWANMGNISLSANTWYHAVIRYAGVGNWLPEYPTGYDYSVHINGQRDSYDFILGDEGVSTNNDYLYVGAGYETQLNGEGLNYCEGRIDELAYWSRAITVSEVADLYAGGSGLFY